MNEPQSEDFSSINFSDAVIFELRATKRGDFTVYYKDWQENAHALTFLSVVGFEWFSPEGIDLSHATVSTDDPFIQRACVAAKDALEGVLCYAIISAWEDTPVLKVAARGFHIRKT